MKAKRGKDHRNGRQRQTLLNRQREQVHLMNVRHQQSQHNHQEDDFGAKQEAIKQVDQRGANAHHRPAEQGEDQYAGGRRQLPFQPLVEAGSE